MNHELVYEASSTIYTNYTASMYDKNVSLFTNFRCSYYPIHDILNSAVRKLVRNVNDAFIVAVTSECVN